jgi:hypothetical protein
VWTLEEGNSPAQPRGEGYQFRIGRQTVSTVGVRPRADAQDAQGQPW